MMELLHFKILIGWFIVHNTVSTPCCCSCAHSQMFMAAKGLDIGKYSRTLRDIDLSKAYESLEPISVRTPCGR